MDMPQGNVLPQGARHPTNAERGFATPLLVVVQLRTYVTGNQALSRPRTGYLALLSGPQLLRRAWVTSRKHLPDKDVAEAGEWRSIGTMRRAYQKADWETLLTAISDARPLGFSERR